MSTINNLNHGNDFDHDSGLSASSCSSTQSTWSSQYDYPVQYGRRYHVYPNGQHYAPNDEQEQKRMNLEFAAWMLMMRGKLFHAPVSRLHRVLDIATGTGKWAEDMGDEHELAEIIGTDLSPIQPKWVPPNVWFQLDNAEESWTWKENTFDLIHSSQMLSGCISNVKRYFEQAYRCCTPGGYFEIHELQRNVRKIEGDHVPDDAGMQKWFRFMCQGIAQFRSDGRRFDHDLNGVIHMMREAGFINIEYECFRVPLGQWPMDPTLKRVGGYQMDALLCGISGLTLVPLIQGLGWRMNEVEELLNEAVQDAQKKDQQYYFNGYALWGRKAPVAAGC